MENKEGYSLKLKIRKWNKEIVDLYDLESMNYEEKVMKIDTNKENTYIIKKSKIN